MQAERPHARRSSALLARWTALALCGCTGLALGGCSSASEPRPPGPAQVLLIAGADSVCADFDARVQALAAPLHSAQVLSFDATLQRLREQELTQLRTLTSTPGTPSAYTTFVADLGALDKLYGELTENAKAGHRQVPASVTKRGRALSGAIASDEKALALSSCAKNPAAGTRTSSSRGATSSPTPSPSP